ncbi:MAG: glycerol kinase GlpK [Anaerolineaceae bacterium]|nr:glycerol kinase GlpK [Anaerolineaceae bacterium]
MSKYIAAIDQGTTSTRCMIFNSSGKVIGLDQKEHQQIFPQPGWVEHDPLEIWKNTEEVIRNVLQKTGLSEIDLAALGITNQRETTLLWDKITGKPFYNAIVWQDTRTESLITNLSKEGGQDRFRGKTGLPLATYFSGPKVKWILDNVPEARQAALEGNALFGNIDSWLIWNLTGGPDNGLHITDVTNASRTMLMNIESLQWDEDILNIMGIPKNILPTIQPSSKVYTETKTPIKGVPVAGILGDQQAALFGQTCFDSGQAKNTYGTGCFMLMNTGTHPIPSSFGLLTTMGYWLEDQKPVYCLEGSIAITGSLVQWLRDNLQMIQKSSDIEVMAGKVKDAGGMYIVPAFSGLYAPYWRADARGVMVGLTRYIDRNHIARAVLEATAYQTKDVLEAMEKDSKVPLTTLKVDGGMVCNHLLMQFQADILNVPVIRPQITETTSLGAAYAAGLAVGVWNNLDELRDYWKIGHQWQPEMAEDKRKTLFNGWKKAVIRTYDWVE